MGSWWGWWVGGSTGGVVVEVDGVVGLRTGDRPRGDSDKVGDEGRDGALEQGGVAQDHVLVVDLDQVGRMHHLKVTPRSHSY